MKKSKNKKWRIIFIFLLAIFCIVVVSGIFLFKHYYNLMDIQQKEEISSKQALHEETEEERINLPKVTGKKK